MRASSLRVLFGSLRVVFFYLLWRLTGLKSLGWQLIRALGDEEESVRTLTGMLLVRAGPLAEPLLLDALRQRIHLAIVLIIFADIGDRRMEGEIRRFRDDPDPHVSGAAQQALAILAAPASR